MQILRIVSLFALSFGIAYAHPMGNFSISHYARFDVQQKEIKLTYALDLAEIPTFELLQDWKLDGRDHDLVKERARAQSTEWLSRVRVRTDGRDIRAKYQSATAQVSDGAGGLPVLRVVITATLPSAAGKIEYEDLNYPDRAGWKEIVIVPHRGAAVNVPSQFAEDRSRALASYPSDATIAPPQDVRVSFQVKQTPQANVPVESVSTPVSAPVVTQPRPQPEQTGNIVRGDYLSRLLEGREITIDMLLLGLCVAFGLGAMHALSPGHGKTIVAAYLVGSRCKIKHAVILGATVTFTHTISVFLLGLGVMFFEQYVAPEKVIPVLGGISGLSIVAIGAMLLYQRTRGESHEHSHDHEHDHQHTGFHVHMHTHSHGGHTHSHIPNGPLSMASLIALGVSGGLVPCPSALVLLLSSVALGRPGLGLTLLVGFSAGLALVLMAIGALVLFAKERIPSGLRFQQPVFRFIPVLSAAAVMVLGVIMTGVSFGWIQPTIPIG